MATNAAAVATTLVLLLQLALAAAAAQPPTIQRMRADVAALYAGGAASASAKTAAVDGAAEMVSGAAKGDGGGGGGGWSAELFHRDGGGSPFRAVNASAHKLLLGRLRRDVARVAAVAARVSMARQGISRKDLVAPLPLAAGKAEVAVGKAEVASGEVAASELEAAVRSGLADGSGEYFVALGMGTPARRVVVVADTGSDVLWVQCLPCQSCYGQSDPVFNPSVSSSFQAIPCGSPLCDQLLIRGCRSNQCLYQVSYGDGSFTVGELSKETLVFGNQAVPSLAIGCGHNNQGLFTGAAGLLGLGKGRLSLPSQLATSASASSSSPPSSLFSYCLPPRDSLGSAPLILGGAAALPSGTRFTPLDTNPRLDTFYYPRMTGLRVGGTDLSINPQALVLNPSSGAGGVILDSGTAVTRFVAPVYAALRDAFRASMPSDVRSAPSFSLFDTCYDLSGRTSVLLPTVSLVFHGGASMNLPAANILVPVDAAGTYCFAFAPNSDDFSIIGNIQQQSFRIAFDAQRARIGIAAAQC